jgi:hypothetical protein
MRRTLLPAVAWQWLERGGDTTEGLDSGVLGTATAEESKKGWSKVERQQWRLSEQRWSECGSAEKRLARSGMRHNGSSVGGGPTSMVGKEELVRSVWTGTGIRCSGGLASRGVRARHDRHVAEEHWRIGPSAMRGGGRQVGSTGQ